MTTLMREVCHGALDLQRFFSSLLILSTICLSGCFVGDFVGAYFNTFYNAQKLFNEAETELLNPAVSGGATRIVRPFLAPFEVSAQTKTKFASIIEKCSKLLQYHPDSKLVDDALLMIGKSYYYQNEHQSAERKFKELLSSYPESNLAFETKLLLANTYYRNNDKATAAVAARKLLDEAKQEGEDGIVGKAALLLAHIEVENKNYAQAAEFYEIDAELGDTPEERSSAFRSVAEMYGVQAKYAKAVEAFGRAKEASKDYIGEYRGQIGQARMLSLLGQYEESLSLLENLIKNKNYREFFSEIDLEIANVYRDQKDFPSAEAQYRYVDTAYARTESSVNSYYQLGLMYERVLFKYDSARVAYDKGRGEYPQSDVTPLIIKRSEYLGKYFAYAGDIARYDSIKQFILHSPDTSQSPKAVKDTALVNAITPDSTQHDSSGTKQLAKADSIKIRVPAIPPPPLDTVQARLAYNKSELAGLFYTSLEVVDSARYWYERLLHDHPNSTYAPRAIYTLAQIYGSDSGFTPTRIDSMYKVIVNRFPESEFAAEARKHLGLQLVKKEVDSTEALYRRAESLVKKGDVALAIISFKVISEKDSLSPYAAKAQYAIGWLYENVRPNYDSSIVNYQRLAKRFPNSQYTSLVQPKLAEVEVEREKKLRQLKADSIAASSKVSPKPEEPKKSETDERPIKSSLKPMSKDSVLNQRSPIKQAPGDTMMNRQSPVKQAPINPVRDHVPAMEVTPEDTLLDRELPLKIKPKSDNKEQFIP